MRDRRPGRRPSVSAWIYPVSAWVALIQIENLGGDGFLQQAAGEPGQSFLFFADILMSGFHRLEPARVLTEKGLHRGVFKRREKILADEFLEQAAWLKIYQRRQIRRASGACRKFERQKAAPFNPNGLAARVAGVDDLQCRDSPLIQHPVSFSGDMPRGSGHSRAMGRGGYQQIRV